MGGDGEPSRGGAWATPLTAPGCFWTNHVTSIMVMRTAHPESARVVRGTVPRLDPTAGSPARVNDTLDRPVPAPAAPRRHGVRNTAIAILVAILVAVVALSGLLFLLPAGVAEPVVSANSTLDYADAVDRFAAVEAQEAADPTLDPACESRLIDHGAATDRVIVLFHGYTNCPAQFHVLADELASEGYTVYVPRMPHHGELDREHSTLGELTADQLIAYTNDAVDLAQGLGDTVIVLGLSGGGTAAAYAGQYRDDVDLAIPISAFLGLAAVPDWLSPAVINAATLLPPISIGESASSASGSGIYAPYASFDNNTRAATSYMRVAQTVLADAAKTPHRAGRTVIVLNENDDTVNLPMIETLEARWEALAPETSSSYRFPAPLGLPHDLIGPDRIDQHIDTVYPVLLDLLNAS